MVGLANDNFDTALYRDDNKPFRLRDSQALRSGIDIYSCSGKLINQINVLVSIISVFQT